MNKKTKWLSKKEYGYVYKRAPRLCVDLLIKNKKGVLLSKRLISPLKGYWHLPGGRAFHQESIEKALQRIAFSEVGLRVKKAKLVGYAEALREGGYIHSVALVFKLLKTTGTPRGSKQALEMKFFKRIPKKTLPLHVVFFKKHKKL